MKAVILAGGKGTRISEETHLRPKPMIEIGGKPLLWHIMKTFELGGITEFIVCLGYKGQVIRDYFLRYRELNSDFTIDLKTGSIDHGAIEAEDWTVSLINTGEESMTGARLKKIQPFIEGETFFLTYGDGLANVDIPLLLEHHRREGRLATVTGVEPPGRFGVLEESTDGGAGVASFAEKPSGGGWINGGFFCLEPAALDYATQDDSCVWEQEPMRRLAADGELTMYRHRDFWYACDTLRDRNHLESLSDQRPWHAKGKQS